MHHRHELKRMPVAQVRQVAHLEFGIYLDSGTKPRYIDAIMRQQAAAQQEPRTLVQRMVDSQDLHASMRGTHVALVCNTSRKLREHAADDQPVNPMARASALLSQVNRAILELEQLQLQLAHVALDLDNKVTVPQDAMPALKKELRWLGEELK